MTRDVLHSHPELARRIGVTLAALVAYRVGAAIPLPGVDAATLANAAFQHTSFATISVMALGIAPYLSALILAEVAKIAWPRLRTWSADVPNARRLDGWILTGALLLAALQAYGLARAMEEVHGLVPQPGLAFRMGIAVSLVAATACLAWLAAGITRHGVGSGLWILVATPHAIALGQAVLAETAGIAAGTAHPSAPVLILALLGLAIAVMTALVKATPPLAAHDEIVWTPILGATAANWLFAAAFLIEWAVNPDAHRGFAPSLVALHGTLPALLAGLVLAALLRRRSLSMPLAAFRAATAVPLALACIAIVLLHHLLGTFAGKPLLPSAHAILMLAAVGVVVIEGLGAAPARAATTHTS